MLLIMMEFIRMVFSNEFLLFINQICHPSQDKKSALKLWPSLVSNKCRQKLQLSRFINLLVEEKKF